MVLSLPTKEFCLRPPGLSFVCNPTKVLEWFGFPCPILVPVSTGECLRLLRSTRRTAMSPYRSKPTMDDVSLRGLLWPCMKPAWTLPMQLWMNDFIWLLVLCNLVDFNGLKDYRFCFLQWCKISIHNTFWLVTSMIHDKIVVSNSTHGSFGGGVLPQFCITMSSGPHEHNTQAPCHTLG